MAEIYQRQGALDHLGLAGRPADEIGAAGVAMSEVCNPVIVNLRGRRDDKAFMKAATGLLGVALPSAPNPVVSGDGTRVIWLGPEEWWVVGLDEDSLDAEQALGERLRKGLAAVHAAVTEVGESRARIRVSGPKARDLLAKGCPLDLHQSVFGSVGLSAQTVLAKATVLLHLVADDEDGGPTFEIFVQRSFAEYLWRWLEDAAGEYGLAVIA